MASTIARLIVSSRSLDCWLIRDHPDCRAVLGRVREHVLVGRLGVRLGLVFRPLDRVVDALFGPLPDGFEVVVVDARRCESASRLGIQSSSWARSTSASGR